ncbi:MAG: hypothetical protein K0R61_536, partial [Microvirga sp.]|nr:hypothetical protein [Microvirga sp.]
MLPKARRPQADGLILGRADEARRGKGRCDGGPIRRARTTRNVAVQTQDSDGTEPETIYTVLGRLDTQGEDFRRLSELNDAMLAA